MGKIVRFRRLKHGDPEEKLKVLPEDIAGKRRDSGEAGQMLGVAILLILLALLGGVWLAG